jgi:phosphinothricin acetyltransferase
VYSAEDLLLRDCEEDDIPSITAIYARAVLTGFGSFEIVPPGEAEMKIRWRRAVIDHYPFIVAEDNRKILGFAYASAYRLRPAYDNTVENSVYVRDGFHGRGIGTRLLSRLVAEASGLDFRQMIAVIGDSDNKGSIKLHEKVGFTLIGILPSVGWKHGRWLDTVLMQRPLGPGDTTPA